MEHRPSGTMKWFIKDLKLFSEVITSQTHIEIVFSLYPSFSLFGISQKASVRF